VLSGLAGNEQLVLNPSDSLAQGDKVTVVADAKGDAKGDGKAASQPKP
jgi:hypothetical protein